MQPGSQTLALLLSAIVASGDVAAMGFGRERGTAVLGHPLDLVVPLQLAAGESLDANCVSAEVLSGDVRWPAAQVRVEMEPGAAPQERLLHIRSNLPVDEPVLTVTLSAGCPPVLNRRFVAFADPPGIAVAPAPADAQPLAPATARPSSPAPRAAADVPRRSGARRPSGSSVSSTTARAASATPKAAAAAPALQPRVHRNGPRLQLEAADPVAARPGPVSRESADAELKAAQAAASAAQAAAAAASAQLQALQSNMAAMRAEAQANRDALLRMERRLAEAGQARNLMPLLLGVLALLAAAVAWLGWRLRQLTRERNRARWWDSAMEAGLPPPRPAAPQAEGPTVSMPAPLVPESVPMPETLPPVPSVPPVASPRSSTIPLMPDFHPPVPEPAPVPVAAAAPVPAPAKRSMSVEEHLDLEQQAEFFLVLGQDEAAIDLLLTHLRGTGGTSPMPYLKLMQIYRRRQDQQAYERMRARFEQRFNAHAPAWSEATAPQRSLEDYPQAMASIQAAWPTPLDAMALVEAMLFRRGAEAEHFELPAYEELVFLYWLAREILQASDGKQERVDVLLPIDDGGGAPILSALPMIDLDLTTQPGDEVPPSHLRH